MLSLPRPPRFPFRAAAAALLLTLVIPLGCDDSGSDPDPFANAEIVHCDMPEDMACIEYQRVRSGSIDAFVAVDEARVICAAGWSGDSTKPGTFGEGPCATDAALARCRDSRGYIELDYYYEGFADTETADDPLVPLTALCKQSTGAIEVPPFE